MASKWSRNLISTLRLQRPACPPCLLCLLCLAYLACRSEAILSRRAHPPASFAARLCYGQLTTLSDVCSSQVCDGILAPPGESRSWHIG
jgi:hypothetical protein